MDSTVSRRWRDRSRWVVAGALVVTLTAVGTWLWWKNDHPPRTTDAPPPTPLADGPPARPTTLLWKATAPGGIAVAPGGYVVVAGETVAVWDLFTGEPRWEYRHPERALAYIVRIADDRMIIQFGSDSWRDNPQRAFHIPTGELVDLVETRDLIAATTPDYQRPELDGCRTELEREFVTDVDRWLVLMECGDHTTIASVAPATGHVTWRADLPVVADDVDTVTITDIGYGMAIVYARKGQLIASDDTLFVVDLATGTLTHTPVAAHFSYPPRAEDVVTIPDGFCAWLSYTDFTITCFDASTGEQRWSQHSPSIESWQKSLALVLPDDTLLLITGSPSSRFIGFRLTDGDVRFEVDGTFPYDPEVAHYDDGVLALIGYRGVGWDIAVYGEAEEAAVAYQNAPIGR